MRKISHPSHDALGEVESSTPVGSDQHREVVIAMATFSDEVVVGNPDTTARETVDALVDTGATFQ